MKPSIPVFLVSLCAALSVASLCGQESTEATVNQLLGQKRSAVSGGKTRGFVPRGAKPAPIRTEKRSVRVTTPRGVPQNIQVSGESKVHVSEVASYPPSADAPESGGKAWEISYQVDPESNVTRTSILFVKDSTAFADDDSKDELERLAKVFKDPALAKESFVIEGHSSAEGSTPHNQQLSQLRAAAIVAELVGYGVAEGKLVPVGFGESKARYEASDPEPVRAQDRRVEIYRLE
ncbi:MAG: OmpA family protein [Verrucomicrobia bacterium]|nr:OmpA family protein [Verrucomicrobiota bacterium]